MLGQGLPFDGLSAPYILDRKTGHLTRYNHHDWHYLADHGYAPAIYGGSGNLNSLSYLRFMLGTRSNATTGSTNVTLSNNYTYGSAGNASGGRFRFLAARTVTNLYFNISSYTGTAANVNDILVELRNDTSNLPGSTVHASQSKDPASATGWINCSGLSFAASADTSYWVSVADPDGNATDNALILSRIGAGIDVDDYLICDRMSADSTNGWSTGTLRSNPSSIVIGFDDGQGFGTPITSIVGSTSSTNRRGFYFQSGFTEKLLCLGMLMPGGSNNLSSVEYYEGSSTTPGTGATVGNHQVFVGGSSTIAGYFFNTPPTVPKATAHRLVFTFSSNTGAPRKQSIGTGADSVLRSAMLGQGSWYWAEANGTTNWSNDDTNSTPQCTFLFEDQIEVATGGSVLVQPRARQVILPPVLNRIQRPVISISGAGGTVYVPIVRQAIRQSRQLVVQRVRSTTQTTSFQTSYVPIMRTRRQYIPSVVHKPVVRVLPLPAGSITSYVPIMRTRRQMVPQFSRISVVRHLPIPGQSTTIYVPMARRIHVSLVRSERIKTRQIIPGQAGATIYVPLSRRQIVPRLQIIRSHRSLILQSVTINNTVIVNRRQLVR
jgi:hypothetical protein